MSTMDDPRTISVQQATELMQERKYAAAIHMCDEILEQMPENASAICIRERSRWQQGDDPESCLEGMKRAWDIAPDSPVVRNHVSAIMISMGRIDEARKLLTEAISMQGDNVQAFFELAEITKFREEDELIRSMRRYYDSEASKGERPALAFTFAKVYDDIGDAQTAMRFADEANSLVDVEFNEAELHELLNDLRALGAEGLKNSRVSAHAGNEPIFIVGMPRSGTTLAETILSRHPRVYAAGETPLMPRVEATVYNWVKKQRGHQGGKATMLPKVPTNVWTQNSEQVVESVRLKAGGELDRFVDKLPGNAWRLPLISRLFPNAPIIYAQRHPLDCAISNYFKRFHETLAYSFRQEWLGKYYRINSETVGESRKIIPNPVLDLSYDLLVADPEPQVRRLLDFVGLEWDDACLTPEQSNRSTVMTASRWQVRQPIYKSSSARWKKYEPYIGDMIAAMGGMEWIEAEAERTLAAGAAPPRR